MSDQNRNVQLGCGTLIAIAIIVMIFSGGRNDSETRKELRALNRKIDRLEQKIDALTAAQPKPAVKPPAPVKP